MRIIDIFDELSHLTTGDWHIVASEMRSTFLRGRLALLVGSGISHYAPSNVPIAGDVAKKLKEQLFSTYPATLKSKIMESIREIPFEVLMGRLKELNTDVARDVVQTLTVTTAPNAIHRQVASLFRQAALKGLRFSVVTTNYDLGISLAVEEEMHAFSLRPQTIVCEEDLRNIGDIELFYIHGALTHPGSLVLDFRDEFSLDRWKIDHLTSRLKGTTLVILGFSGWDLDVSDAIALSGVRSVIWVRTSRSSSDVTSWSTAARHLVSKAYSCVIVNSSRKGEAALADLAPDILIPTRFGSNKPEIDQRYGKLHSKYSTFQRPWYDLWARWIALRAGFSELGSKIPRNEYQLLTKAQALEVKGRAHLYAGHFRTAAMLQKKAAYTSLQSKEPIDRYLNLRSHEVDYWNRGACTPNALATVITAALQVGARLTTGRSQLSGTILSQLSNLLASLLFLWPLPTVYVLIPEQVHRLVRPVWRAAAQLLQGRDFDKYNMISLAVAPLGTPEAKENEERYHWLGQEGRLINLYRVTALRYLRRYYYGGERSKLDDARRLAYQAAQWSYTIGDPYRLGKSLLAYVETQLARWSSVLETDDLLEFQASLKALGFAWPPSVAIREAWQMIGQSEVWLPYYRIALAVYMKYKRRDELWSGRIRFAGLALLETT